MPKMRVYFAHPFKKRFDPDKYIIIDELKSRNLMIHDPFEEEDNIVKSYGLDNYWDDPNWDLAREMWTRDLQAITKADFLLGWLPDGVCGNGTSKEITYAYLLRKPYIQVICSRLHPALAVEAHQQFLTIGDFIARRPYKWKKMKKLNTIKNIKKV